MAFNRNQTYLDCTPSPQRRFFRRPTKMSAMLAESNLSERCPCGHCDDDTGKTEPERRPNRRGFRATIRRVKEKIKMWWIRDKDAEEWNNFVDEVISKRKQTERPIRTSPMTIRFERHTHFDRRPSTRYVNDVAKGIDRKKRRGVL
ncbi:unnamed protein product [Clonostachys byssicola]|uniref:Uncharacterized protein n=1 Tax=Clonostachys byssicola TaxID=160290 RepID=A0A9N9UGP2_9HYPO|nr:unnamed protein product [Clonostachys byssicola]